MTDRRKITILRWVGAAIAAGTVIRVCSQHQHGGMKGISVPLLTVAMITIVAAIAAAVTRFGFKSSAGNIAAPFVSGIAGVFTAGYGSSSSGPYGGILGLLVGTVVVLIPLNRNGRFASERQSK